MAANRSSLNTIDEVISASLLLPQQTCKLTPHEVIGSMNYIESAVGDEIAEFLQHNPDATIETMCTEIPLIANIRQSLQGINQIVRDIESNPDKKINVQALFAVFIKRLKADYELAKTINLSSLCKDLAKIIEYCRKNYSYDFTLEVLNRIISLEYINVANTFPAEIADSIKKIHHFLHASELVKNKFESYNDDKSDLMNRINRKVSELKKQYDAEAKPKLSEEERVLNDFAVIAPIPMPGLSPLPAAEIKRRPEPKKAILIDENEEGIEPLKPKSAIIVRNINPPKAIPRKTATIDSLIEEIQAENYSEVRLLLETKLIDVNRSGKNGLTPLCLAIIKRNENIVDLLLQNNASPSTPTPSGSYPIIYAADLAASADITIRETGYAIIKKLSAAGASLNTTNRYGRTVNVVCDAQNQFMDAVATLNRENVNKHLEMAKMFVDLNKQNSNSWTALAYATSKGDIAMIKHLLSLGANPDVPLTNGTYPIHFAAELAAFDNHATRETGYAIIKIFREAGANFGRKNRYGRTVHELCNAQNQFMDAVKTFHPENVKKHLDMAQMFVDINKQDSSGWTALNFVTAQGNITMINYLLSLGAYPDVPLANGTYPIHFAAELAASDNRATRETGYAIIKILREAGANVGRKNRYGRTVHELCNAQNQFMDAVKTFHRENVKKHLDMAQMFVDVNKQDSSGWTALNFVTAQGNITMINYLLSLGADPDVPLANGTYPIHFAAELAASDNRATRETGYAIIKIFKEAGANVGRKNRYGRTVRESCNAQNQFMDAIKTFNPENVKKHLDMAQMFVDVNKQDSSGWTALNFVTAQGNITMINYLLSLGADPDVPLANGTYPIHFAAELAASDNRATRETGYAIIKIFKEAGADFSKKDRYGNTGYQLCHQHLPVQHSPLIQNSIFQDNSQSPQDKLLNAVVNGESDKVTEYLNNGADCNYIYNNTKHKTLINYLLSKNKIEKNDLEVLNVLFHFNAKVGLQDDNKNTSLDIICNRTDIPDALRGELLNKLLTQHEKNSASEIILFKR